jgi:phosphonate ABC transporter permease subunit PhnE
MSRNNRNRDQRRRGPLFTALIVVTVFTIYAIGVQVTQIDLDEPLRPRRQENLIGLLRQLADPDFFTHENETRSTNISLLMPCPEVIRGAQTTVGDRVLVLSPNCATTTQDAMTISGEGFAANVDAVVRWYPEGVELPRTLTTIKTNARGAFERTFTMPDIRFSDEPQRVEVVELLSREITGLSRASQETLDRIVETILMALMASTLGTLLAIPISFLGARNLMSGVGAPLASLMAVLIALPIGATIGARLTRLLTGWTTFAADQPWLGLGLLLLLAAAIWGLGRLAMRPSGYAPRRSRVSGYALAVLIIALAVVALAVLAHLGIIAGQRIEEPLGFMGFVGNFIYVLSDFLRVFLPTLAGLAAGVVLASYASRVAQERILRMPEGMGRFVTALLAFAGVAMLIYGIAAALNWICIFNICSRLPEEPGALFRTLASVAAVGGGLAALLSLGAMPKRLYPIGMVTYAFVRTTLNTLRAIEPVIMGFVLVVWVGIGPFAGVLALMLHSIADLGKLFSEQVENIEPGPVEAVTATGASFVQRVVYAVVPQVVPHYTAFVFYRWDINVRLSTIIGFVGGGGIGLILFRSTNLTQYRQAAVMVIAIAIVVTFLDYVSSKIRARII